MGAEKVLLIPAERPEQLQQQQVQRFAQPSCYCPHSGIARTMKASNIGTVNAVCPWAGLQIMPFRIKPLRNGPALCTLIPNTSAISPDRRGPAPSDAMARR
jgi:hypothetical protein